MAIIYKSKISIGIVLFLAFVNGFVSYIMITNKAWLGLAFVAFSVLFIVHMFMTTYYSIQDNRLNIKSGFLYNKTIEISSIKSISSTNSLLSAPATSLDRLEIQFNKFDRILVSPKEKQKFIDELIKINSKIKIRN